MLDRAGASVDRVVDLGIRIGVPGRRQVAEAGLVGALWGYAAGVLYPSRALKRGGVRVVGSPVGELPQGLPRPGLGRYLVERTKGPGFLAKESPNLQMVEEFDRFADLYEPFVAPFSTPIFAEALEVIRGYLAPDSRVLDVGCGPGRELRLVAAVVPEGEAIGVDLAAGMVRVAHSAAQAAGLENCAFFQADVGDLPRRFHGRFDVVYSCLAHHHYPDPVAAAASVLRCLRPGGVYCVVDAGPAWFNALSTPIGRRADPGWVGWKTPDEFRALLTEAGFERVSWIPLLPGFGMAVGQRAIGRPHRDGRS
jgi:SAM-dependent methyltransferase